MTRLGTPSLCQWGRADRSRLVTATLPRREIDWETGPILRSGGTTRRRGGCKDPIGIAGGLNQYVFCDNNGVNLWILADEGMELAI